MLTFFCILTLFIFTDVKTNMCAEQVDADQDKKVFGEDNTEYEKIGRAHV